MDGWKGLLAGLAFGVLMTTNATALHVDRSHQEDSVALLASDQRKTYVVRQVETASLLPYCLAVVAEGGGSTQRIWPASAARECFSEGYAVHEIPAAFPVPGGQGRTISAVVSVPYADDNVPNAVLCRLTVEEQPVATKPDGGGSK